MQTGTILQIRKGKQEDLPEVLALIKELATFEKAPDEVVVTLNEMQNWGFGKEKVFDFFVAINEDRIVGLALYYFKYSTWKGRCLFLEDIIVTEAFRGKGLGKKLFEKVAMVAKMEKVKRMEWQVLDWNEPAIQFYKKYPSHFDAEWINCKLTDNELINF
jgi:GNAT superfamily N-acetyltransferase